MYPKACCSVLGLPLTWPGIIAKLYPCLLKSCLILYEAPLPVPISFLKASSIVWAFTSSLAKSEEVVLVGPLSSNMYSQRSAQQFMIQKKKCWTVNVCSLFCVLLNKKEADLQLKSRRVGVLKTLLLTVWKWQKFSLTLYCQKFREKRQVFTYLVYFTKKNFAVGKFSVFPHCVALHWTRRKVLLFSFSVNMCSSSNWLKFVKMLKKSDRNRNFLFYSFFANCYYHIDQQLISLNNIHLFDRGV